MAEALGVALTKPLLEKGASYLIQRDVAYDIDDLIDELATDALQKKINRNICEQDLLESGAAEGSVVLVTTRSAKVASIVSANTPAYELRHLPFEDCWSIFSRCAFKEGEEQTYPHLVKIGTLIVDKCGGVPLAVQTSGSLLCGERNETVWMNVLQNDLWKIDTKDGRIMSALIEVEL
ncbi:hypothetical protein Ancab_031119 [Ancistrocladus abbreviatus]